MRNARFSTLFDRAVAGRSGLSRESLAINLSYVLHESSTSDVVQTAVDASLRHTARRHGADEVVIDGPAPFDGDAWIVPSLGIPDEVSRALDVNGYGTHPVVLIDRAHTNSEAVQFFRAPAILTLPGTDVRTLGVAALIVRPKGRSYQLLVRGPFKWPVGKSDALRAVEDIIQAHVEQWHPGAQLWERPAEITLPDEIQ